MQLDRNKCFRHICYSFTGKDEDDCLQRRKLTDQEDSSCQLSPPSCYSENYQITDWQRNQSTEMDHLSPVGSALVEIPSESKMLHKPQNGETSGFQRHMLEEKTQANSNMFMTTCSPKYSDKTVNKALPSYTKSLYTSDKSMQSATFANHKSSNKTGFQHRLGIAQLQTQEGGWNTVSQNAIEDEQYKAKPKWEMGKSAAFRSAEEKFGNRGKGSIDESEDTHHQAIDREYDGYCYISTVSERGAVAVEGKSECDGNDALAHCTEKPEETQPALKPRSPAKLSKLSMKTDVPKDLNIPVNDKNEGDQNEVKVRICGCRHNVVPKVEEKDDSRFVFNLHAEYLVVQLSQELKLGKYYSGTIKLCIHICVVLWMIAR